MTMQPTAHPLRHWPMVRQALGDSWRKLDPRRQVRNPVMFVVLVGAILTTALFGRALLGRGEEPAWFILAITLWLWFTVLFANFAEAMADALFAGLVKLDRETGGGVFSVSSISYAGSLAHNGYDNNISCITENVLRRFAGGSPSKTE